MPSLGREDGSTSRSNTSDVSIGRRTSFSHVSLRNDRDETMRRTAVGRIVIRPTEVTYEASRPTGYVDHGTRP
jgi:hypothetical protein